MHGSPLITDLSQLDNLQNMGGYRVVNRERESMQRTVRIAEAAKLWAAYGAGQVPDYIVREAMRPSDPALQQMLRSQYPNLFRESHTLSDFASLTDDVLQRTMLNEWSGYAPTWNRVAKRRTPDAKDFRTLRAMSTSGGRARYSRVHEKDTFPRRSFDEDTLEYKIYKYEAGYEVSWEAQLNDEMNIFGDMPRKLTQGGQESIEYDVTSMYVDADGLHDQMFDSTNIIASHPKLNIDTLGTAFAMLMEQRDVDGRPIVVRNATLIVGGGNLWVTANNLKNMLTVETTTDGGKTGMPITVNNWLIQNFDVVYNPWIPTIATSNASTMWVLVANPDGGMPAIEIAFLRGYSEPQLFRKASNTIRIGGGVDEQLGDFETMSTEYKGLIVYGMKRIHKLSMIGSNGSGAE
jgi:hypothetical protein